MRFLNDIPLPLLIGLALVMLGAPFAPEPHLVEKARMLAEGRLTRPIDLFDVFWHLLPTGLLVLRLAIRAKNHGRVDKRSASTTTEGDGGGGCASLIHPTEPVRQRRKD